MSRARLAIAIVGAGGLARAIGYALARSAGASVTITSRRPQAAAGLARSSRGLRAVRRIEDAVVDADIVLLAVPDRAIAQLAGSLVPLRAWWSGVVVLHAAGAYGPELLAQLRARGAATGVFHPLAVLGPTGRVELSGASARLEGTAKARTAGRQLCRLIGLVPLTSSGLMSPEGRRIYHAAASLASNDLVALLAAGQDLLVRRGVPKRAALDALVTLAESALRQVRSSGLSGALTGPVARNDGATLLAQLRALAKNDPEAYDAHRALSLRLVDLALASGRLDRGASAALRQKLARSRRRVATV